jgi:hypothetical protein
LQPHANQNYYELATFLTLTHHHQHYSEGFCNTL